MNARTCSRVIYSMAILVLVVPRAGPAAGAMPTPGGNTLAQAHPVSLQIDTSLCVVCHGPHGEGGSSGAPRLAGQNLEYMTHALSMFKATTRASPLMQPIAQSLTDVQISELAEYFSEQSAPSPEAHAALASSRLALAGEQLAKTGAADVAACFGCHAAGGKGNGARFPSIAGQPAKFIIDRLHEFQARAKSKTPKPGTMTAVAATLSEQQIEASAAYLSQLD
jgi:cytochrome c553